MKNCENIQLFKKINESGTCSLSASFNFCRYFPECQNLCCFIQKYPLFAEYKRVEYFSFRCIFDLRIHMSPQGYFKVNICFYWKSPVSVAESKRKRTMTIWYGFGHKVKETPPGDTPGVFSFQVKIISAKFAMLVVFVIPRTNNEDVQKYVIPFFYFLYFFKLVLYF